MLGRHPQTMWVFLFFKEIADKLNILPEECIMVGNDEVEDMSAAKIGMQTFLINRNKNTSSNSGTFDDFVSYVENLLNK